CQLDVGPVDPGHDYAGVRDSKRFKNAALALHSGGGCECENRWAAEGAADSPQPAVIWPEILAPAVDAVSFIDDQVAGACLDDLFDFGLPYHLGVEPLRCTVQEFYRTVAQQLVSNLLFAG